MIQLLRRIIPIVLALALAGTGRLILAQSSELPRTPTYPPRPPQQFSAGAGAPDELPSRALALPPLKAVLLVGPIDGDDGPWTTQEKQNMDLAASELEANGVTVYKFYAPNNNWSQVKAAANGAHFLFYRGHGVYWSPMPTPTVGGFALSGRFVSSDDIRQDLEVAPNAIVMLYGCFTAGSSGNDNGPISSAEAQRRVAQYSHPFLDIGAAGYYANWFGDAFQMFVRYLFQGKTLGQAYEAYFDFNSSTVERYTHPNYPARSMWLDKDDWGYIQYNNAFVGLPDRTLTDLFQPSKMDLSPTAVTVLAETDFPAQTAAIRVNNAGPGTFTWTATITTPVPWMSVQSMNGTSGQSLTMVITPTGMALGTHMTRIRIVAGSLEVQNRDQTLPVTLRIVEQVYMAYLPVIMKPTP